MVTWFNSTCEDSPTRAHHFIKVGQIDSGDIFLCLHCHRHRWLPASFDVAEKFSRMIRKVGEEEAYYRLLSSHRAAMRLITKLDDLWYVRKEVTDNETFVEVVKAVMKDRGYRKEIDD